MTQETLPPESEEEISHKNIMDQLLPLRDRIVKMETVVNYHDKEFQTVKNSIGDLTKTVEFHHNRILSKLDEQNKNYMDVMYEQYRESSENNVEITKRIQDNKTTFEAYVARWKAVTWAVWFTITITLAALGWGLSAAQDLGFFDVRKINAAQEIQQQL